MRPWKKSRTDSTAHGIAPTWIGTCSACATSRAPAAQIAVEKSRLELRICEYAVRSIASPISCTMDSKRWVRTLTVIGSAMAHLTIWKLPLQNRGLVIGDALLHDEDGIDAVEAPGVLPEEL